MAALDNDHRGAAEQLVGQILLGKWKVEQRIRHDDGISGTSRSACYRAVLENGDFAFVKAFDFRNQERGGDTDILERMVREYNYERNVHLYCADQKVSRVTRIHGAGQITIGDEVVHFIICEWAERCLREAQPPGDKQILLTKRFIALRDTASAVAQLHRTWIAHQDIKPSNAVCLAQGLVKLTDLGSSSCEHIDSPPHDLDYLVGQPNYAPYELLYESPPSLWRRRRFGCDLFLLGNLCFTSLVGASLSVMTLHAIPTRLRHTEFGGEYAEVLPHLIEAHENFIAPIISSVVPDSIATEVIDLVAALCHPDPMRRGHPKSFSQHSDQFNLERVITKFNRGRRTLA